MIQQTATQWDLITAEGRPPLDEKYFVLALVVVCAAVTVKLVRIWLLAPPLRQTLPSNLSKYRMRLELAINAFAHWLWLPLLFWLFLSSHRLYILFGELGMTKAIAISATSDNLQELSKYLLLALSVTAYAFLLRWHLLVRLTKLRD